MASFFNKISDAFNDFIDILSGKQGKSETMYDNTETNPDIQIDSGIDLSATDEVDLRNLEDEKDYWWKFAGHPQIEVPAFEAIDDKTVYDELHKRIDANEFPIIEIPDTVMKTMSLLNKNDFDYREVTSLIQKSPGMAGEFIKVMNSSLYRRGVDITDLKLALPRLGKKNIKAMLFMYSTKLSLASNPLFNDLAVKIVDHSYATALIASYLSQRFYPDPEGAFLAGLLHDSGKLGILKAISESYDLPNEVDFEMTEDVFCDIFPNLHERAGKFLATNWKVEENVLMAIEHHHDFIDHGFTEDTQLALHLSALINLSDTMARILGKGSRIGPIDIFSLPACVELNFDRVYSTFEFLEDIPEIVAFKTSGGNDNIEEDEKKE